MKRVATPLTIGLIEERLEEILDAVLSSRRTATEPARTLAKRHRPEQDFIFYWLGVIIRTNSEMGFQFVSHASRAFELMDFEGVEAWIIDAMDIYDRHGLYPGSEAFANAHLFAAEYALRPRRVDLEESMGFSIVMSVVCRVETSICKRVMTPSLTQKPCFCLPRSHSTATHNKISCCIKQLPPTCGHKLATEPSNERRRVMLCCLKSSIVFLIRNKPEHCSQDSKLTVSMLVCAVIFPA